jgi:hypothetical protein
LCGLSRRERERAPDEFRGAAAIVPQREIARINKYYMFFAFISI